MNSPPQPNLAKMANAHMPPVTPPPEEHDIFTKELFPPEIPHPLAQQMFAFMGISPQLARGPTQPQPKPQPQSQTQSPPHSQPPTQSPPQPPPQLPFFPIPSPLPGPTPHLYDRAGNPIDPRYVAMASRISAYYQQRCAAVSAYQVQRCQQWAAAQRQKSQDMMQAAMLVVAWYVRDRISRRRRRARRAFRKGLARRGGVGRAAGVVRKGERVRKWVVDVPEDVLSAGNGEREALRGGEERGWEEGQEGKDKETELFRVADELIRSRVGKLVVPILGGVDLGEESESESSEEEDYEDDEDDDEEMDCEEDEEYEDAAYKAGNVVGGRKDMGSQEVHVSSGENSRKRRRSSVVS